VYEIMTNVRYLAPSPTAAPHTNIKKHWYDVVDVVDVVWVVEFF
jgi:hypothetical protein